MKKVSVVEIITVEICTIMVRREFLMENGDGL